MRVLDERRSRRCSPAPSSLQHRSKSGVDVAPGATLAPNFGNCSRSTNEATGQDDAVMPAKNMALSKNDVSWM